MAAMGTAPTTGKFEAIRPEGSVTPVCLMTDFAPGRGPDVPDPYYTRDFDGALDLIEAAARGLLGQIGANFAAGVPPSKATQISGLTG